VSQPTFTLPRAMREEIIAHARREAPRECCGVISGENGNPIAVIPLTNVYAGDDFFEIDATELYRVYRDLDDAGQEIIVNYHSHPVSVAYPSVRDVAHAQWGDIVYLICSLEFPEAPSLRAYHIADGEIVELTIEDA
jgi:proteasome lid subunit RPN8/RPN11